MKKRTKKLLLCRSITRRGLMSTSAMLAGCSVLPERAYQERREWPLDVPPAEAMPGPANGPVLLVRGMRAGPGLDSRGLRTIQADGAEHLDFWEEWAVPPPQGVEDSLRQCLAASGLFSAVIMPGSEIAANFVLETELVAFAADRRAAVARAAMSVVLLRKARNGQAIPILQRSLTGEAPLSGADGPAVAASLRAALASLLLQSEAVVKTAM